MKSDDKRLDSGYNTNVEIIFAEIFNFKLVSYPYNYFF